MVEEKMICGKCGADVSEKVRDYSKEHFGKVLCYGCQKDIKEVEAERKESLPEEPVQGKQEELKLPEGLSKEHIVMVQGKPFIKYSGLLDMATKAGLVGLEVKENFVDWTKGFAHCIVKATFRSHVLPKEGSTIPIGVMDRVFDGFGSAHPQNVSPQMVKYFIEMAHTRAKARALRDALNVSMVSVEELESLSDAK